MKINPPKVELDCVRVVQCGTTLDLNEQIMKAYLYGEVLMQSTEMGNRFGLTRRKYSLRQFSSNATVS
jgi:hypothetical protein